VQLIYHASLIGQATGKNKGKIARMLAAKSALGLRVDALSTWGVASEDTSAEPTEEEKSQLGRDARLGIERRLRALEGKPLKSLKDTSNANTTALGQKKWEVKEARKYNPDADGLTGDEPAAKKSKTNEVNGTTPKKLVQEVDSDADMVDADAGADASESSEEEEGKAAPKGDSKAVKKAEKEAKKARKAERAAKRAAKEAKKAAKDAKKSDKDSKKRKADDGDDKDSKKKKKKSKD
jgi:nucleolar protein 58